MNAACSMAPSVAPAEDRNVRSRSSAAGSRRAVPARPDCLYVDAGSSAAIVAATPDKPPTARTSID